MPRRFEAGAPEDTWDTQEPAELTLDAHDEDDLPEAAAVELAPRRRVWTSVVAALLATSAIVGVLLVHVWSRYRVLDLGYQVSTLSREREALLEEQRRLQIEMQVLTRTERLEPAARRQMALITPTPEQVLYVPSSRLPLPPQPLMEPKGRSLPSLPALSETGIRAGTLALDDRGALND